MAYATTPAYGFWHKTFHWIIFGLIAGLIAVVIIGAVTLIGGNLTTKFQEVANALSF